MGGFFDSLFYRLIYCEMWRFSALVVVAISAAQETCIVCSAEETQTVKTYSNSVGAPDGKNDDCFRSPTTAKYPTATCQLGCYSLFYAVQKDGRDGRKLEQAFVERGCIYTKKVNGVEASFRAKADSCANTALCDVTLTEKNYGNVGTIKAKYDTKVTSTQGGTTTFPTGANMAWSKVGLKCYQCGSAPRALADDSDPCYNGGFNLQTCPDINSTTCFSTVSNYEVFESDAGQNGSYVNYHYALRGCSVAPSSRASSSVNPIVSHGVIHADSLGSFTSGVNRTLETTFCATDGCNKNKMSYVDSSALETISTLTLLSLLALAF